MSSSQPQTELSTSTTSVAAADYNKQSNKLSLYPPDSTSPKDQDGRAVEAKFITPLDPVVVTASGDRLPTVPIEEAHKINLLKDDAEGRKKHRDFARPRGLSRFHKIKKEARQKTNLSSTSSLDEKLGAAIPPSRTHPLFPPLPLYGPPSLLRNLQCILFKTTSAILSTAFLAVIVLGSVFTSIPKIAKYIWIRLTLRDPDARRPFYEEEKRRAILRKEEEARWRQRKSRRLATQDENGRPKLRGELKSTAEGSYVPTEGGPDPLVFDVRYYARRVGLEMEEFKVQTEDGFILSLWHVYDPKEYQAAPQLKRRASSPEIFGNANGNTPHRSVASQYTDGKRRYPILLMHGLLQSVGAYCSNDDDSLAFFLHKSGYDVWLGNNRCGFDPEHALLSYNDPRLWAWNIRQMGVMDLPAFISRVLEETGFGKLGLVCHSQGTTQTFVALAKEQRPDLGDKISVFCALAPAAYAGPLIGKMYFKFMRIISPAMFRVFFGIHAFIPLMMTMHRVLPGRIYGFMGYRVFSFLFNWTDTRWDRGIRDRLFQFSPVYVSSESMRWWLGRECFAKQKCVLSTREEGKMEDAEDEKDASSEDTEEDESHKTDRGRTAWYDEKVPPIALWVAGSDDLVDGRRLLRRFERGREPHVDLVHSKVIPEYEHLDVIWAIDAIEQVGTEVREVLWRTMDDHDRDICRLVEGVGRIDDSESSDEGSLGEKAEGESGALSST